jgi:transposase InsO family protein
MRKYPNLLKQHQLTGPEQAWVSDITYIRTEEGFCYLSLITDAYSRKIMGYSIADSMEAAQSVKALRMALSARQYHKNALIHHSDRGIQYCSREYVALATGHGLQMSMTENGDPYENALAERMNRTIKEEFLLDETVKSKQLAILAAAQAVRLYNYYRPHQALGWKTPDQVHKNQK